MTKSQHKRTTVASMFKIGISQNTKCAVRDGFCKNSHICYNHMCKTKYPQKICGYIAKDCYCQLSADRYIRTFAQSYTIIYQLIAAATITFSK